MSSLKLSTSELSPGTSSASHSHILVVFLSFSYSERPYRWLLQAAVTPRQPGFPYNRMVLGLLVGGVFIAHLIKCLPEFFVA